MTSLYSTSDVFAATSVDFSVTVSVRLYLLFTENACDQLAMISPPSAHSHETKRPIIQDNPFRCLHDEFLELSDRKTVIGKICPDIALCVDEGNSIIHEFVHDLISGGAYFYRRLIIFIHPDPDIICQSAFCL